MLQLNKFFLFLLFFFILLGCGTQSNDTKIINNLTSKFPQLKTGSDDYNLIRSVSFGDPSITIKLFSQLDSVDDKQEILLLTNSDLHSYAIPLFSNTYRDYWNFRLDSISKDTKPINTTFEKELNICLNALKLNDMVGTAEKVVNEIFYSLLHCQDISLSDSSNFQTILVNFKNSLPQEDSDSCYKRLKRNWDIISQDLYPNKTILYKHSYWDKGNARVYQLDFKNFKRKQKNYFKVNAFRQDCNWHMLTL